MSTRRLDQVVYEDFEAIQKDWPFRSIIDATESNPLPSEKREPEVLNHFHERSAEKKLGGETDDTKGNDEH